MDQITYTVGPGAYADFEVTEVDSGYGVNGSSTSSEGFPGNLSVVAIRRTEQFHRVLRGNNGSRYHCKLNTACLL